MLYSGRVVMLSTKFLSSGKSGCIKAKRLYGCKVVVFGQKWL